MLSDLRHTFRALLKRPSFAAGTMLVLSLAVGVNTAVFSLVNALLLQPLHVPEADRIAFVYHSNDGVALAYAEYRELRQKVDLFDGMAARAGDTARLRSEADPIPMQGEAVSAGYFELLGVRPLAGRTFTHDDDSPVAAPVALISEALWKAQFAGTAQIIGRTLRIDTVSLFVGRYVDWRDYTIIGVMPTSFTGTGNPWQRAQYWVPIDQRAVDHRAARGERGRLDDRPVVPVGRLKPGVTFAQARSAVDSAGREIIQRSTVRHKSDETFRLLTARRVQLPFQGSYYMDTPRILVTLGAVATLLLVIAGINLAGMLLARGVARRGEIAIRLSLGITRFRLVRQLLAESVVVAVGAGAAGLLLARLLITAALNGMPSQIPGWNAAAVAIDVPVDVRVIAFAFGTGLLTALVIGLAPAVQALRVDLLAALSGATSTSAQARTRLRRIILVPQVSLSLVLLLVTGLFVRELLRLELAVSGFDATRVVTLDVQFPQRSVETAAAREQESQALRNEQAKVLAALSQVPVVGAAALTTSAPDGLPLAAIKTTIITRRDYETTRQYRGVTSGYVSSDYFSALGIPVLRGRGFDARERTGTSTSVLVSERLASELWPGTSAVGQQLAMHSPESRMPIHWLDVVGVVGSVIAPVDEQPRPVFYLPIEGSPLIGTTLIVRGTGNPAELITTVKQTIGSMNGSLILAQARPLAAMVSDARYPRRFSAELVGLSGAAALALAAVGVFAMMSYAVAQRLGEIGVRMVLGADRRDIMALVIREGGMVAIAGIFVGFALSFAAIRYASHAFVPLPDVDVATFLAVPLLLAIVVLAACYVPARRAAAVDPLVVLRKM